MKPLTRDVLAWLATSALALGAYAGQRHPTLLAGALLAACVLGGLAVLVRARAWSAHAAALPCVFSLAFTLHYALYPAVRSPLFSLGVLGACAVSVAIAAALHARHRFARIVLRAALVAASSCATVLGGELVWRRVGPENPYELAPESDSAASAFLREDALLGIAANPGFRGRFTHPEFGGERVEIHADGFRGARWPSEPEAWSSSVLLLGDSTLFGFGVEQEHTVAACLERALADGANDERARVRELSPSVQVHDASIPGYGPRHAQLTLERLGPRLRPATVVVEFYDVNDLADTRHQFLLARAAHVHDEVLRSESELQRGLFAPPDLYAASAAHSQLTLFERTYWVRYSSVCRMLDFRLSSALARLGFASVLHVHNNEFLRATARAPDFEIEDELELVRRALQALRACCAEWGARLVLLRLPGKLQCEPTSFRETLAELGQDERAFDRTLPGRGIVEWAREQGFEVLDLLPTFEVGESEQSSLYYREGHPNRAGNERIATAIAELLRKPAPRPAARPSSESRTNDDARAADAAHEPSGK